MTKKTHRLAISLDSIKFPNNFVLTKSNNLFKSNKITNFNKKTHFKPTCLCIVRYIWFTDTIRFIQYALMYRTSHEHLRYETFCTRYDTYRVSYDTNNYVYTIAISKSITICNHPLNLSLILKWILISRNNDLVHAVQFPYSCEM